MNNEIIKSKSEITILPQKDYINHLVSAAPKEGVLFADFVRATVIKKSRRMSEGYSRTYNTLLYNLDGFCKQNNCVLFINSINEDFLEDFIIYLQDRGCGNNYISGLVTNIKGMVKRAAMYNYLVDPSYDNVEVKTEDTFSVYLSMNDITRIYYYKGLTRFQEKIKDLFVIGCLTALRYSDYSTLAKTDFQGDYIHKLTKKTKAKVIIPMHDYVKEIYKNYNGDLVFGLCNQHFNRYIKKICKEIGFTDKISYTYNLYGETITVEKEKWELISSHTARRSAATNMYLTQRMSTLEIMNLTGHTTERSFFRYIKVSKEDTSNRISKDVFFKK